MTSLNVNSFMTITIAVSFIAHTYMKRFCPHEYGALNARLSIRTRKLIMVSLHVHDMIGTRNPPYMYREINKIIKFN